MAFSSPLSIADLHLDQDTTHILVHDNRNTYSHDPGLLDHYDRCTCHLTKPLCPASAGDTVIVSYSLRQIFSCIVQSLFFQILCVVYSRFRKTLGAKNAQGWG